MKLSKVKIGMLATILVLLLGNIFFAYMWLNKPCPPCYEAGQTVVKVDTIPPADTTLKAVRVHVPEAYKVVSKKRAKIKAALQVAHPDTLYIAECDTTIVLPPSVCDSVLYYSDTIRSETEQCKAVINDTVMDNRIVGRSVWLINMKPEIRTTITEVRKDKVKFYIGAAVTINARFMERWGAGPQALLTFPKVGGVNYYYDARNNAHTAGFMALIRFRR